MRRGAATLLLLAAGCLAREADPVPPPPALREAVVGTLWRLEALPGAEVVPDAAPTLELGAEGVAGTTGCNRYSGSATLDGDALSVGPLRATRRACSPPLDEQERRFVALLSAARRIELSGESLLLFCAGTDEPLRFAPAPRE